MLCFVFIQLDENSTKDYKCQYIFHALCSRVLSPVLSNLAGKPLLLQKPFDLTRDAVMVVVVFGDPVGGF